MNHLEQLQKREKRVTDLVCLIKDRELAPTAAKYQAYTDWIQEMLGRIEQPTEEGFNAVAAKYRPEWAQIMGKIVEDIESGDFTLPFKFEDFADQPVLFIRISHINEHLVQRNWLRDNCQTIRSNIGLKRALLRAGVLVSEDIKNDFCYCERAIAGKRVGHMLALSVTVLAANGVDATQARKITEGIRNDK